MPKHLFPSDIIKKRQAGERISALTAYDFVTANLVDAAGIDIILVGDSLGTVIQGHETTLSVTLEETIYHTKLVARAVKRALVVSDMPFLTFQVSAEDAVRAAGRIVKETGAPAVKMEGGEEIAEAVRRCVTVGIPVMGHVGLRPQAYYAMGGYRVQGKTKEDAAQILASTKTLEQAGAFAIVLEGIPHELGKEITAALSIPTIGIGAGPNCSGQILVLHDLIGLRPEGAAPGPKFVKQYADLSGLVTKAIKEYIAEVHSGAFPSLEHSYESARKPWHEK